MFIWDEANNLIIYIVDEGFRCSDFLRAHERERQRDDRFNFHSWKKNWWDIFLLVVVLRWLLLIFFSSPCNSRTNACCYLLLLLEQAQEHLNLHRKWRCQRMTTSYSLERSFGWQKEKTSNVTMFNHHAENFLLLLVLLRFSFLLPLFFLAFFFASAWHQSTESRTGGDRETTRSSFVHLSTAQII